jgi:hypothetical protein
LRISKKRISAGPAGRPDRHGRRPLLLILVALLSALLLAAFLVRFLLLLFLLVRVLPLLTALLSTLILLITHGTLLSCCWS